MEIKIFKTSNPRKKPQPGTNLGFGKIFTDHMFVMDYNEENGWHDARIVPYGPIELEPSAMVFHYGQEMFEGMKAYLGDGEKIYLFRPYMNAKRANNSNKRLCIPQINEDDFVHAVSSLVDIDRDWIPTGEGESLYIRPFVIATDSFLGVAPSKTYKFIIIASPSGAYYKEGLKPVSIWIEDEYVRAVRGGIGFAKTGGNYVASMIAQKKAHDEGYSQVLWLDGVERKYIEEVGAMNIFFKINGKLVTPELSGSILPGVTRDSIITIARDMQISVSEEKISVEELVKALDNGEVEEVFGSGTAAVISPVGRLRYKNHVYTIGDGNIGQLSQRLYDTLTGIQCGRIEDKFDFRYEI